MKRTGIMVFMLLFVLPICSAYESSVSLAMNRDTGTFNIQPVMLKYEPFPVSPGEYMDVWIKFENEESGDINDLTIEYVPEYPFYLDAGETKTRHFGSILAHSSVVVKFRVRVDADAVEGDRYFRYKYRYYESEYKWEEVIEKIRVQTREALLSIESVDTEPEKIVPGQEARVTITLKNQASSVIRDIGFYLDLTMSSFRTATAAATAIESYYNAIPLAPVSSSSEKRVTHLRPGEEAKLEYDLIAFPDAESKIYKVPVVIAYKDEIGTNYTKFDIIGLVIGSEPELDVKIEDNTIYGTRQAGDITVKIVNKGVTDVKFMNVIVKESDDYEIVSEDRVYLGDVDSDDYETADFKLYVKNLDKDDVLKVPVKLEYKDATNKEYNKDIVLEMTAYSPKMRGMAGSSKLSLVVFLVIVMVAGWFFYKRWEKKKKAKKEGAKEKK